MRLKSWELEESGRASAQSRFLYMTGNVDASRRTREVKWWALKPHVELGNGSTMPAVCRYRPVGIVGFARIKMMVG